MPPENLELTFIFKNGEEQSIPYQENESIMQVAVKNDIRGIEGVCGGCIACATCHIYIHPDWSARVHAEENDNEQSEEENDMLDMAHARQDNSRLGCQIKLTKSLNGLKVYIP